MAIRRRPKQHNYCVLDNTLLQDKRLSFKARGIASFVLSMPENYHATVDELVEQSPDGRDYVAAGLRELEEYGYLVREKYQDERGRWKTDWLLDDVPQKELPEETPPATGFPTPVLPTPVKPVLNKSTSIKVQKRVVASQPSLLPEEPEKQKPNAEHEALMLTLSEILLGHRNHKVWTYAQAVFLGKAAKKLRQLEVTVLMIRDWYVREWSRSYFGQKGERPNYNQLMEGLGRVLEKSEAVPQGEWVSLGDWTEGYENA